MKKLISQSCHVLFIFTVCPLFYCFNQGFESRTGLYEVSRNPKDIPVFNQVKTTIDVDQMIQLRHLLENKNFETLNNLFLQWQLEFETECIYEYKIYDALRAFECPTLDYDDLFEEWVGYSPSTWVPFLARAAYYEKKGWESRGGAWGYKTSDKQFEGMYHFFSLAEKDLNRCIAMNDNLFMAYDLLICIYNGAGAKKKENRIIDKASQLFPYSFIILSDAAWATEPRWGGNYKEMENIARSAERYLSENPELSVLYGLIFQDQADMMERKKKYDQAKLLYEKALTFGENSTIYDDLARLYYKHFNDPEEAIRLMNRSIELRPVRDRNYILRSRIYFSINDYEKSLADLYTAQNIAVENQDILDWRQWVNKHLTYTGYQKYKKKDKGALEDYEWALLFDNWNKETYYWRGVLYYNNRQFDSAVSDFKNAIYIDPEYFQAYQMLDYSLMNYQDWDSIIKLWDQFLELKPNHAEAYFERSGTYYHKKDMARSMKDLEKACQLGHKEACQRLKHMKGNIEQY